MNKKMISSRIKLVLYQRNIFRTRIRLPTPKISQPAPHSPSPLPPPFRTESPKMPCIWLAPSSRLTIPWFDRRIERDMSSSRWTPKRKQVSYYSFWIRSSCSWKIKKKKKERSKNFDDSEMELSNTCLPRVNIPFIINERRGEKS